MQRLSCTYRGSRRRRCTAGIGMRYAVHKTSRVPSLHLQPSHACLFAHILSLSQFPHLRKRLEDAKERKEKEKKKVSTNVARDPSKATESSSFPKRHMRSLFAPLLRRQQTGSFSNKEEFSEKLHRRWRLQCGPMGFPGLTLVIRSQKFAKVVEISSKIAPPLASARAAAPPGQSWCLLSTWGE